MKLWIDDQRPAPDDSWTAARSFHEAIDIIEDRFKEITHIAFDGYLDSMFRSTGKHVLKYIDSMKLNGGDIVLHQPRENYTCHSADSAMNDTMNYMIDHIMGIHLNRREEVVRSTVYPNKTTKLKKLTTGAKRR